MIRDALEAYGMDYAVTMRRFLNNEKTYLRFFGMLFNDESLARLGEALEAGDMRAAFEAAHTLKGVVGNMGLTPLYDKVCEMVEPLRMHVEDADYKGMYQGICAEYERARELYDSLTGGE